MKKLWTALLSFAIVMAAGMCTMAGTFDGYWDFEQADGTYAYGFPRILVAMDKAWYQNTKVVLGENGSTASFYHKGSYDAYAEEGMTGGLLFTIGASVNTDFQDLPSFVYLGFDEEEAMNYYALLPTDYQAYMGDEEVRSEYDELWSGVEDVLASAIIKGSEKFREIYGTGDDQTVESEPLSESEQKIISSGDYDYLINDKTAAIVKYTGDAQEVTIPSEINEYQVTEIGAEAFRYRKMKSVSIPGSIRSIGRQAFEYCEITQELSLPVNCAISEDAFSYAVLPPVVTIPAGTQVEACAFSYCELVEKICVDPGAVLKSRAFGYCDDLRLVVLADGTLLEKNAFEYCRGMEKAFLCGNVQAEEGSFADCGEIEVTKAEAEEYDTLKQGAFDGTLVGKEDTFPEEGKTLEIINSPASLDGVTVTLKEATAQRTDTLGFDYTLSGMIENNSDEGIMQVIYTFALIDENGEEFRSFGIVYDGEDKALPPGASADFFHDDIRWGKQSIPAAVEIGISSVKTEKELPPAHVPQMGEYLYQALGDEKLANIKEEPPIELSFHVDQGGYGRTAEFTQGEALDKAVELLCAIKIGAESGEWVTDNYNGIGLKWADGTYTGISLNLRNLEYWVHSNIHTYELENLGEFWSYCAEYLEEDHYPEEDADDSYEGDEAVEASFSPYDFITGETGNGKYLVYTFPDICLLIPAGWKDRYLTETDEYGVNFYQKASHDRYLDEGVTEHGGFLFRFSASEDESFRDLPDYRDLGYSENAGLYFYLKLPSDVRFYNDPEIREEYGEMSGEIDLIADMAQIRKSMHFYTDGIESTDPGMS